MLVVIQHYLHDGFFEKTALPLLPHPPVSPDLNPIEHVWDMLGRRLRRYNPRPTALRQVEVALQQIWRRLPQRLIRRCINMRQRLQAVIQNRGGNTPH